MRPKWERGQVRAGCQAEQAGFPPAQIISLKSAQGLAQTRQTIQPSAAGEGQVPVAF